MQLKFSRFQWTGTLAWREGGVKGINGKNLLDAGSRDRVGKRRYDFIFRIFMKATQAKVGNSRTFLCVVYSMLPKTNNSQLKL